MVIYISLLNLDFFFPFSVKIVQCPGITTVFTMVFLTEWAEQIIQLNASFYY